MTETKEMNEEILVREEFTPKHHDWCSRITFVQGDTNDQRNLGSMNASNIL